MGKICQMSCAALLLTAALAWPADRPVVDIGRNYFEPSRACVTPHIAWANPRAGGPLSVLFIGERKRMREAVELAQRLEMDFEWFGLDYYNFPLKAGYFRGGYYKGDEPGAREARLWQLLFGRPRYDLIVLGGLDWTKFPEYARVEILRQVAAGTGLIRLATGRGADHDELLQKALAGSWRSDAPVVTGVPWQVLPVFAGYAGTADWERAMLKIARHGSGIIVSIIGYEAAPFQLLAPGFSANPMYYTVPEWWGRRTPAEKARYHELDMPFESVRLTDYDYYLAWLVKLMLFAAQQSEPVRIMVGDAARRESRENWRGLSFTVQVASNATLAGMTADWVLRDRHGDIVRRGASDLPALAGGDQVLDFECAAAPAGQYFADLWLRRAGQVVAFGSQALEVSSRLAFQKVTLAASAFSVAEPVRGTFELAGHDAPAAPLYVRFRQTDSLGRLVRMERLAVSQATMPFTLAALDNPRAIVQFLDLELWSGAELVDRRRQIFTHGDMALPDTIRLAAWQRPETSYLSMRLHQRLHEIGFEASGHFKLQDSLRHDYFGMGSNSTFKVGRFEIAAWANLQFMPPVGRFADATMELKDTNSIWLDNRGVRRLLITPRERHPCLNDPQYRELCRHRARAVVAHYAPYSTTDYFFDQEPSFCQAWQRPAGDRELCFCENCQAFFHAYLRRNYGSVSNLNAEYESTYTNFTDVVPRPLADVVNDRRLAPLWADFRLAMDESHAGFYQELTMVMAAAQPTARTGVAAPIWFGLRSADAGDMWRMSRWQRLAFPYYHLAGQMNIDFALPDSLVSLGTLSGWGAAYSRSIEFAGLNPWRELFAGANLFDVYYGDTGGCMLAFDFTLYRDFQHLMAQLLEIKSGVGRLFQLGRRDAGGVAVLYSPASIHYAALASGDVLAHGAMDRKYRAWVALLHACGHPFRFVASAELMEDILVRESFRLLILPGASALSALEITKIKQFVRNGGSVLADLRPGVSDGHCKPYIQSPMDDLFGVKQDTGWHWPAERSLVMRAGAGRADVQWPAASDALLGNAGGRLDAGWAGNSNVVIWNEYGKGRGLLLNMAVDAFVSPVTHEHHWPAYLSSNAPAILPFFQTCFGELGVRTPVEFVPAITGLQCQVFTAGRNRYVGLLPEMPEPLINYAAGQAQPLRPHAVTAKFDGVWHVYDVRRRQYCGFTNQLELHILPGQAMALACLPYRVSGLEVAAPANAEPGRTTVYQVVLKTTAAPGRHVLAIEIITPTGTTMRPYAQTAVCENGRHTGQWTPAFNDPPGRYSIRVRDVASGVECGAEVVLLPADI